MVDGQKSLFYMMLIMNDIDSLFISIDILSNYLENSFIISNTLETFL